MMIMLAVVSVGGRMRWVYGFIGRTGHFLHETGRIWSGLQEQLQDGLNMLDGVETVR